MNHAPGAGSIARPADKQSNCTNDAPTCPAKELALLYTDQAGVGDTTFQLELIFVKKSENQYTRCSHDEE